MLRRGAMLKNARLAYKTFGTLNAARTNVVVYPTSFGAQHPDMEWLVGRARPWIPANNFIVIPNMFGNGLSSSPSDHVDVADRRRFPRITMYDNVMLQHRLLRERFDVQKIALVVGFSMGGQQDFHWGVLFPGLVARCLQADASTRRFRLSTIDNRAACVERRPFCRRFSGGMG